MNFSWTTKMCLLEELSLSPSLSAAAATVCSGSLFSVAAALESRCGWMEKSKIDKAMNCLRVMLKNNGDVIRLHILSFFSSFFSSSSSIFRFHLIRAYFSRISSTVEIDVSSIPSAIKLSLSSILKFREEAGRRHFHLSLDFWRSQSADLTSIAASRL